MTISCSTSPFLSLVAQVNEWQDDWPTFFTRHRLQSQLDLIEKDYADREARELWSQLQVGTAAILWEKDCPLMSLTSTLVWGSAKAEPEREPLSLEQGWSNHGHIRALTFGSMGKLRRGWPLRASLTSWVTRYLTSNFAHEKCKCLTCEWWHLLLLSCPLLCCSFRQGTNVLPFRAGVNSRCPRMTGFKTELSRC